MFPAVLLFSAALFVTSTQARTDLAAELKDAQAALAAGDYDAAYSQYLHFATEKNNPLAQFTVAMFHQSGWGSVAEDRVKACGWHQKAASSDIPASAHFYAECVEQGIGEPADPKQAAEWYERAAGLGHYQSWCSLGNLYIRGKGVAKDPQKGLALCKQAVDKGAVPARMQVGLYLLEGDDSIRDVEAAHEWFQSIGYMPEAKYRLGLMHRDGIGHEPSLDEARLWFERAASEGYVPAYFPTAKLYFEASPDLQKQPLTADFLAKTYMWLSATVKVSPQAEEVEQAHAMLEQVLAIMPDSWEPTLDERVTAHLAEHP